MGMSIKDYKSIAGNSVSGKSTKPRKRHNPDHPIVVPTSVRRVLAIDPGQHLGWAVVEIDGIDTVHGCNRVRRIASGHWSPSSSKKSPDKWTQLWAFVRELSDAHFIRLRHFTNGTIAGAVELPNPNGLARGMKFSRVSLVSYGMGVGTIFGALRSCFDLVLTPSVAQWKGNKKKSVTAAEAKMLTGYSCADENESDALGIACWVLRQS